MYQPPFETVLCCLLITATICFSYTQYTKTKYEFVGVMSKPKKINFTLLKVINAEKERKKKKENIKTSNKKVFFNVSRFFFSFE